MGMIAVSLLRTGASWNEALECRKTPDKCLEMPEMREICPAVPVWEVESPTAMLVGWSGRLLGGQPLHHLR